MEKPNQYPVASTPYGKFILFFLNYVILFTRFYCFLRWKCTSNKCVLCQPNWWGRGKTRRWKSRRYLHLFTYILHLFTYLHIFTGTVDLVSSNDTEDWPTQSSPESSFSNEQYRRRQSPVDQSTNGTCLCNWCSPPSTEDVSIMEVSVPKTPPPPCIDLVSDPSIINISSDDDSKN